MKQSVMRQTDYEFMKLWYDLAMEDHGLSNRVQKVWFSKPTQPFYFNSLTALLRDEGDIEPMVNLAMIDIFSNPSFVMAPRTLYQPVTMDTLPLMMPTHCKTHHEKIVDVLCLCLRALYKPFSFSLFLADAITRDWDICKAIVRDSPAITLTFFQNVVSFSKRYEVFQQILEWFPSMVQYINEPCLNKLALRDTDWFLEWYHTHHVHVADHISYSFVPKRRYRRSQSLP